jgi:hypothetical protein
MNANRLSTNLKVEREEHGTLDTMAFKLLSSPSNYEMQSYGKILIKSLGTYKKG